MSSSRWERILEAYERLRTLLPDKDGVEDRASAIDAVLDEGLDPDLAEDAEAREELRQMLAKTPPEGFLSAPAIYGAGGFGGGFGGQRLGDFELDEEIGRGGMGVVYSATQLSLQRTVAVKLLPLLAHPRSQASERFRREARAASALAHPHIVEILAYGEEDDVFWYAMRHVPGHDLARELHDQRDSERPGAVELPPGDLLLPRHTSGEYVQAVIELFADLAGAIAHAHERGVVHRDVKPQNILLDESGAMHLTDFGLAKDERFGSISASDAIQGTPYYMSPEQARANKNPIDHRTDIYSLGVVMYETLSLRRPFEGSSSIEILTGIAKDDPKPLRALDSRLPQDLSLVVMKCMAKTPSDRYASAAEVEDELRRFLRHEAVLVKPPGLARRIKRRIARHRLPLGAAALGGIALLSGLQMHESQARGRLFKERRAELESLLTDPDWSDRTETLLVLRRALESGELEHATGDLAESASMFEGRLAIWRGERLARAEQLLESGLGGLPIPGALEDVVTGSNSGDLALAAREFELLRTIWPDDAAIAAAARLERRLQHAILEAVRVFADGSSEAVSAAAQLVVLKRDPVRDEFERLDLGELRLGEPFAITTGWYRFVLVDPGHGHAELDRQVSTLISREPQMLKFRVHALADLRARLIEIPSGEVELPNPDHRGRSGCYPFPGPLAIDGLLASRQLLSHGEVMDRVEETGGESPGYYEVLFPGSDPARVFEADGLERWRRMPAFGLSMLEARECLEHAGLRMPTHKEAELLVGRSQGRLAVDQADRGPGLANLALPDSAIEFIGPSNFQQLATVLDRMVPVDDPRFSQPPFGLLHGRGNGSLFTSSPAFSVVDGVFSVVAQDRMIVGPSFVHDPPDPGFLTHGAQRLGPNSVSWTSTARGVLSREPQPSQ